MGWRNDSYRHYLAAKGVKTRYFSKGNFLPSYYKKAFAEGLSRAEFEERLRAAGRNDLIVQEPKKTTVIDRIIAQPLPEAMPQEELSAVPVPEERIGLEELEQMSPEERVLETPLEAPPEEPVREVREPVRVPGRTVMTPGVPESPSVGFNIL